ncbi:MAG: DUF819 family protein [Spirochaetes bacterium]|nr:DUF819 family protein [Spirochaetota bacterium]MBU1082102.1 DUF819 family protein [Spirochaetota bacterium]
MNVLLAILFIAFPALLVYLCYRFDAFRKIGTVLLCYIAGMVVGNVGILPAGFAPVQTAMADMSVALALPLLLFSLDVRKWFRIAGKGMLCMLLATLSIIAVTFALQLALRAGTPDAWQLSGLAVGVYTGGTPNLAAIKSALGIDSDTYILFHTYDTVISLFYIFLMSSVARPFFVRYMRLRPYLAPDGAPTADAEGDDAESIGAYAGMWKPAVLKGLGAAILLSAAIVGASAFLGGLLPPTAGTAVTILSITTLGIAASFVRPVRRVQKTFQAGMYVIYVFCFVVASMTRLDSLIHVDFAILGYVAASIFGSLLLHAFLCRVAKIDADTFIVTSVSAICSPPFVPVVAAALKNKAVLITGLTTGIVGYAIGNYLGISIAYIFKGLPF